MPDARGAEDRTHLDLADRLLDLLGREHALHRVAQLLEGAVDDRVGADLDALAVGDGRRVAHRAHVEADDHGVGRRGEVDVGLRDAADAGAHDVDLDVGLRELGDLVLERLQRARDVGLEHEVELHHLAVARRVEDALERYLAAAAAGLLLELEARGALAGERAGAAVVLDHAHELAGLGHGVEAEHLDGLGRAGLLDAVADVVVHRAHAAPVGAGHERVADLHRPALHEHGDHGAAAGIEARLDDHAGGLGVRVGRELLDLGDQEDRPRAAPRGWRASWRRRRRTSSRRPTPRAAGRAGSSPGGRARAARPPCRSC